MKITKRLFDIIFSFISILVFSPLFILVVALIKIFMPGPVFFIQNRVGKNGKEFKIWKFRTMYTKSKTVEGTFNIGDKSLITSLGKVLRKTKIDELPQLVNILRGNMSFVGPRPEVKKWTNIYTDKWIIVHTIKPGITDNASIEFRNEEEILSKSSNPEETYRNEILPRKLKFYVDYVNNNSILGDISIILRTIIAILYSRK